MFIPLPFDPDEAWGSRTVHHVAGTVNGCRIRTTIERVGTVRTIALGPATRGDRGITPGDEVEVVLAPEGPQRLDLADVIVAALAADPAAADFFDSLATFYRKGYLRWIDATKRRPEVRVARIAEMIELLKAGHKERPAR